MLVDLEEDGVQDEAGGLRHVQGLFSLGQPVDGVLQRRLETRCQGDSLIQLGLKYSDPFRRTKDENISFKLLCLLLIQFTYSLFITETCLFYSGSMSLWLFWGFFAFEYFGVP